MRALKVLITIVGATKFPLATWVEALERCDHVVGLTIYQVALQICSSEVTCESFVTLVTACLVDMEDWR